MIYVPDYVSTNCAYILNNDVIRVYESVPTYNTSIAYKDYYFKNSYMYNTGTTSFGTYSNLPVCISSERITTDIYYRNDLPQILFIFIVFTLICIVLPLKIFGRMFRRYL